MKSILLAFVAAAALAAPAAAQDNSQPLEAGDTLLRVRAILVAPQEDSSSILPTFPGEGVKVGDSVMPEIDVSYMLTDNIGLELIAATTKHDINGRSGTTGGIGKLGSTWVLPPTLTVQYHFNPQGNIRPYVGAGLNYTIFYSEKASGGLEAAVGSTNVELSDSFGPALQAGVDVSVGPNTFLNFDVKWIDMDTTATIRTTAIGTQKVRVNIDPLVFGVRFGWRF